MEKRVVIDTGGEQGAGFQVSYRHSRQGLSTWTHGQDLQVGHDHRPRRQTPVNAWGAGRHSYYQVAVGAKMSKSKTDGHLWEFQPDTSCFTRSILPLNNSNLIRPQLIYLILSRLPSFL
jgi:hypothetical protein